MTMSNGSSYLALIVDDDEDSRDLMATMLATVGFVCAEAPNAESAIESIASARPDAIVTDLSLPTMSGEELARAVRASTDLAPILLVATSGRDVESVDPTLFDIVSRKPVDFRKLLAEMNALFDRRAKTGTFSSESK